MTDIRYAVVPAGGTDVTTMSVDGAVYVPMRLIVDALGLHWQNEHRRITGDPIMSKAVIKLMTAFSGGQEALCLPLTLFHGWLFKLNLNTVNEKARPIVEALQIEGYQVLHDYWVHGSATNQRHAAQAEIADRTARRREIPRLMDMLERERNPAKRRVIHAMLVQNCEANRLAPPGIEEIGRDAPPLPDVLAPFWAGIAVLRAKGTLIDHSRVAGRLALNLKEVAAGFVAAGVPVRVDGPMKKALRQSEHPRFTAIASVNSAERGKTVSCFVFEEASLH